MNNLSEALELADHNLSIIPIKSKEKYPAIDSWKPYQQERASKETLERWFANTDNANIGVITGKVSNVVVLDIDNVSGIKPEHVLPDTPTVKTNRGYHYYFKHPGFDFSSFKIMGLGEVQSDGKYVVAPPSIHPSGVKYEWLQGFGETPLADMPDWLLSKARDYQKTKDTLSPAANDNSETTAYGKAWFADVEELAREASGGRNDLLNKVACKAGSLIQAGQLNEKEATQSMLQACKVNGLVKDDGYGQTMSTIRSGIEAGKKNPRSIDNPTIQAGSTIKLLSLDEIEEKPIDWLWPGVIAKDAVNLWAGPAGLGKSSASQDIAARVSSGGYWPGSKEKAPEGNVIIMSMEDDIAARIKPRLIEAGANFKRIRVVEKVSHGEGDDTFKLDRHLPLLKEAIKQIGSVSLIVIDPITGYLGDKDQNKNSDIRPLMDELTLFARDMHCAILVITHLNKNQQSAAINQVTGAGAFVQAARTYYQVKRDQEDWNKRLLTPGKNNIAKDDVGFAFSIQSAKRPTGDEVQKVVWENTAEITNADQVIADHEYGATLPSCMNELRDMVSEGSLPQTEVFNQLKSLGYTDTTIRRAKDKLGLKSKKLGAVWHWGYAKDFEHVQSSF